MVDWGEVVNQIVVGKQDQKIRVNFQKSIKQGNKETLLSTGAPVSLLLRSS